MPLPGRLAGAIITLLSDTQLIFHMNNDCLSISHVQPNYCRIFSIQLTRLRFRSNIHFFFSYGDDPFPGWVI